MASNRRPRFVYRVLSAETKQVIATHENPYEVLVTLRSTRQRYICTFKKDGNCKGMRGTARLRITLESENKSYNHFTSVI